MSIDTRFVTGPSLEMYFVDKDSAFPLTAGKVYFFSDVSRTTPKDVYALAGSPPNYTFTPISQPVTLNSDGTFSDNFGDNIIPFFYPFTGKPDENTGVAELYFVQTYNSDNVFQWARQAWPPNAFTNNGGGTIGDTTLLNYIPNGQLLFHNDVPFVEGNQVGQIVTTPFVLGPGGFEFQRAADTSTDLVNFVRIGAFTTNPQASPRYWTEVNCQIPVAMAHKRIVIKFADVNKFATTLIGTTYTFAFTAQSNNLATFNITASFIKNFGTAGSADVVVPITLNSNTVTNTSTLFYGSFSPGNNTGKTIGPNNDDYCYLSINLPTDASFDLLVTDYILTPGTVVSPTFPVTTNAKFAYQGAAGGLPVANPDGSDLYLPIVYTQTGFNFSDNDIGKIYTATDLFMGISTTTNEIRCDGEKLITQDYSPLGIPFSRLQKKIFSSLSLAPFFGTGLDYAIAANPASDSAATDIFNFHNNTLGSVSPSADGAGGSATGFSFETTCTGTGGYTVKAFESQDPGITYCINNNNGVVAAATSGNSTIPVGEFRVGSVTTQNMFFIDVLNSGVTYSFLQDKYFTFSSYNGSSIPYYVWFKVDGGGTDPVPGGTGIPVNLNIDDNLVSIARKISSALNGFQASSIQTTGVTAISLQNKYWTFFTTGGQYFVWYNVDNAGVKPVAMGIAIEVAIITGDTASQIATKTVTAINSYSYQVPDFRGYYLKGYDENQVINQGIYYTNIPNGYQDITVGSIGLDNNISHRHTITQDATVGLNSGTPIVDTAIDGSFRPEGLATATDYEGYYEVDVKNILVNYVIKY